MTQSLARAFLLAQTGSFPTVKAVADALKTEDPAFSFEALDAWAKQRVATLIRASSRTRVRR
ncbi:hypothetical protein sos41_36840 [Alphaproteobacteria bacterium SO-S41]|nr:hypothetical protein sos41_36840 [Alphaproteobacteria bacterium SO-S41]